MSGKRIAVIGSRSGVDAQHVYDFIRKVAEKYPDATIVSGRAPGVDTMAEDCADKFGLNFDPFPADWRGGKRAGKERNWQLAGADLDELAAFWDGWSNGTSHAVTAAVRLGVRPWVFSPSPADLGIRDVLPARERTR